MKTVTVRDLRNHFSKLEAWLAEGEQIRIEKRGEPIAMLTAIPVRPRQASRIPNFAARRRAIWGKRAFSETDVAAMRADEFQGEEG
ncbi:MAG: prevent-host-death protein [Verrucomicrobia bacterium]|nr:prevent-host-death protein [Verrucomicrobiota bacterium]